MSRISFSALFVSLGLAACQSGGAELTTMHRDALVDSVRTFLTEYVDAVNSGSLSATIPYYADDEGFTWAEDGRLRYPSHGALVTALDSLAGTIRSVSLVVDQPKVVALTPGLAALSVTYRESITDTAGQVARFAGVLTTVVGHREGGWKFLLGHSSTNPEVR